MSNYNNTSDTPSEKKVWRYTQVAPCPHNMHHFFAVQELLGAWVWSEEENDTVFEDADLPRATRVTYMKMDSRGFARNVHSSAYNGDKHYQS